MSPETCPNCGADVPVGAAACPECGADENTGWSDRARNEALGIPDEDSFDYDEFVRREFQGEPAKRKNHGLWVTIAIVLLILFLLGYLL